MFFRLMITGKNKTTIDRARHDAAIMTTGKFIRGDLDDEKLTIDLFFFFQKSIFIY